jgi:hypothetical protein
LPASPVTAARFGLSHRFFLNIIRLHENPTNLAVPGDLLKQILPRPEYTSKALSSHSKATGQKSPPLMSASQKFPNCHRDYRFFTYAPEQITGANTEIGILPPTSSFMMPSKLSPCEVFNQR